MRQNVFGSVLGGGFVGRGPPPPPRPDVENFLKFGIESAFWICIRKLTEVPKGVRCFSLNFSSKSVIILTNGESEVQI